MNNSEIVEDIFLQRWDSTNLLPRISSNKVEVISLNVSSNVLQISLKKREEIFQYKIHSNLVNTNRFLKLVVEKTVGISAVVTSAKN